jgi:hypothetical protein
MVGLMPRPAQYNFSAGSFAILTFRFSFTIFLALIFIECQIGNPKDVLLFQSKLCLKQKIERSIS